MMIEPSARAMATKCKAGDGCSAVTGPVFRFGASKVYSSLLDAKDMSGIFD